MNRAEKAQLADTLKEKFVKSQVTIFADYKGLTANQADDLRKKVRATHGEVRVLKNNIARLAVKEGFSDEVQRVMDGLAGAVLVAFAYKDPAATAKVINEFGKDNEAFQLRESIMGKNRIAPTDIQALADLPSREVLLAQLLGVLNGPARNFVSVLAAVPRGFVTVLNAIADKKKEAGGA